MSQGKLEIREQPRLPLSRQVEICADGIGHRLFRSLTTLAVVTLAVAFLMNMLVESITVSTCKVGVGNELSTQRRLARLMAAAELPPGAASLSKFLSETKAGSLEAGLLANWMGMDAEAMETFRSQCVRTEAMRTWLERLNLANQRMLFDTAGQIDHLAVLAGAERWEAFAKQMVDIPTLKMPGDLPDVVDQYNKLVASTNVNADLTDKAVRRLREALAARSLSLRDWLARAATEADQAAELSQLLRSNGIELTEADMERLADEARVLAERAIWQPQLQIIAQGKDWRKHLKGAGALTLDTSVRAMAAQDDLGVWLVGQITQAIDGKMDSAGLTAAAKRFKHTQRAEELNDSLSLEYGDSACMGGKAFWLIVVSLVVCVVGITNAMLVSVLERFREIATMKCLGAMDGLIATLFLLEAAVLGLVGGVVGVVLGAIIGMARMFGSYGDWVWKFFPTVDLLVVAGVSVVIGLVLTTLAAIYPAFRAAKMLPMEAMRVE